MKLSSLVAYRNALNALSTEKIKRHALHELSDFTYLVETNLIQLGTLTNDLNNDIAVVGKSFDQFESTIDKLKTEINNHIAELERPWFQESYRMYEKELVYEDFDQIAERRPKLSQEVEMFYRTRIKHYTNWKHAGMIIRPGVEDFIDDMVCFDPLYLLDLNKTFITPSINRFNEMYQNRLRPYVIFERNNQPYLVKVPNGQFAICLVYNFFNYRPLEIIRKYLTEIYQKLKPGGTLIMTFNDCDSEKGVLLVEQHCASYTPGGLIKELATSIGYEQAFSWSDGSASAWLELRKPGELTSLRGGQSLAKVVSKTVEKSK